MTWTDGDVMVNVDPERDELEHAIQEVPRGALTLAGIAVGLLMLAWLGIYLFVFLPRGSVG